jgi:hypothetical protein
MYGERLYYYSGLLTSLILIPIYVSVLMKARVGSKFKFVNRIVWLMIVSNIAIIVFLGARDFYTAWEHSNVVFWCLRVMLSIATFLNYSTFNVAHWMFAMEYYSISRSMPFVV